MTRRSFLTNLGLACAALGLPVAAGATQLEPCVFAALDPAFGPDTYAKCWIMQTDDGLIVSGGRFLSIHDPLNGRSVDFDSYRMNEISELCDVVRAMRPAAP